MLRERERDREREEKIIFQLLIRQGLDRCAISATYDEGAALSFDRHQGRVSLICAEKNVHRQAISVVVFTSHYNDDGDNNGSSSSSVAQHQAVLHKPYTHNAFLGSQRT